MAGLEVAADTHEQQQRHEQGGGNKQHNAIGNRVRELKGGNQNNCWRGVGKGGAGPAGNASAGSLSSWRRRGEE